MSVVWGAVKAASAAISFAYAVLILGRYYNALAAAQWFQTVTPVLAENFASHDGTLNPISLHEFETFASGRKNIRYFLAKLDTRPRQDWFLGWLINAVSRLLGGSDPTAFGSFTTRDKLVIELGTSPASPKDHFSFVYGRRFRMKGLKNLDEELSLVLARVPMDESVECNGYYCVLSDCAYAARDIVALPNFAKLLSLLGNRRNDFCSLHISDIMVSDRYPAECRRMLRLEMALPQSGSMEWMRELMETLFRAVDDIAAYKLTEEGLRAVKKSRQALTNAREERQRELLAEETKKKREEEEAERAAKLAQMSPADRAKAVEKLEKKKARSQLKVIKH